MMRKVLKTWMVYFFVICSLFSNIKPVSAQEIDNTDFSQGVVTFLQLGSEDFTLTGPIDSDEIRFGIPASWSLKSGAELVIYMDVSFDDRSGTTSSQQTSWSGGAVTIVLNNIVLGIFYLESTGPTSLVLPIPVEALQSRRDDGLMELEFELTTGFQCDLDQITSVVFHSYSRITLPHSDVTPNTDLKNFPRPLFSDSFIQDTALIVVPDKPTSNELQAALTIGAGLGNIAGANFLVDLMPVGKLNSSLLRENHLIFVGRPTAFDSFVDQIDFQSIIENGRYVLDGIEEEDGVIQMVPSPWSLSHVVLFISGNTDAGVVKSAQALTTGVIRSGQFSNVAVVKDIQSNVIPSTTPTDFTLADLGYSTEVIESQSSASLNYEFNIPPGKVVGPDAFFELAYGHSGLLNFDRSGIVVLLNDQPIGSVKLSEESAIQPINKAKINIPPSLVQVGVNRIEILMDMTPLDVCISRDINSNWITVWSESQLHLPLSETLSGTQGTFSDLSVYPAPYINAPSLETTAFILPSDDFSSWQGALNIASFLGNSANGSITLMEVFFADEVVDQDLPLYNFIIVGMPNELPIIKLINNNLPAPFNDESNIAVEKNMPATFLIPSDIPIGYVELLQSPWNASRVIIASLGNSSQGITWATTVLGDSPLGSQLAGNFAVVNDQKVITTDTRLSPLSVSNLSIPGSTPNPTPIAIVATPVTSFQPVNSSISWIPTTLVLLSVLFVITLIVVGYTTWIRNRTRNGRKPNDNF